MGDQGLTMHTNKRGGDLMDYAAALAIAARAQAALAPYCRRIAIAGSIRRQRPQCKDIELVVQPLREPADLFGSTLVAHHGCCAAVNRGRAIKGQPAGKYMQRRLQRLERQHIRQLAAEAGRHYGLSAADIPDEARCFFALSEAGQDRALADAVAQAQARGDQEAVGILNEGWATVRSYR